jgi:polysaccharide biosynthesis/export protein
MRSTAWMIFAALAVILPLAACGSKGSDLPLLENAGGDTADYHLGPGDRIHVQVFGSEDLSGDYLVGDDGTISSSLIGEIKAAGATRAEVERSIEQKLANNIMKNPKVSVTVLSYRPYYIYGEVVKPGAYPFASGIRVESAIATAGGFTYRAEEDYVLITRKGKQYRALLSMPIQPDDIIRVAERHL